ncbi:MAG TPA: CpsB/CapC family capsule biosynthesis tyrosine phosphatase [Flavipsychrobacter sp.]|nr:CpsB/CapC family capsule biosynthesis tyrosine phosphatase [Flavipsychrobacter sp.]
MFSRLFGSKEKKNVTPQNNEDAPDWSFLATDIHSHYIPGIDDGAQTIEDSIELVLAMKQLGFKSLVTTPHVKYDHFPNTTETITTGLQVLKNGLSERGIDMPIKAAAEYYIDDYFMRLLQSEPLLTINENEVLVELSFLFEPVKLHETLFKIQSLGYRPILAHPERYAFYHSKPDIYRELKDKGCLLQLNSLSLTGYYGKPVKQIADMLLEQKLYDYAGSDMHHIKHAETLRKMMDSRSFAKMQQYPFKNSKIKVA